MATPGGQPRSRGIGFYVRWGTILAFALLALIQLVPYGRDHSNPRVTATPRWDSARTAQLVRQTCADCHSNRTRWPWYTNVAPMSWLIQHDVDEGRGALDFSEWDKPQPDVGDVTEKVRSGEMPPWKYTLLHPGASLSAAEKRDLIAGLQRTWAKKAPPLRRGGGGG